MSSCFVLSDTSAQTKGFTKGRIKIELVLNRLACDSHSRRSWVVSKKSLATVRRPSKEDTAAEHDQHIQPHSSASADDKLTMKTTITKEVTKAATKGLQCFMEALAGSNTSCILRNVYELVKSGKRYSAGRDMHSLLTFPTPKSET